MAPTSFAVGPRLGTMLCCCAGTELGTLDAFLFFQVPSHEPGRPILSSTGLGIPGTYFCP